MDWHLGVKAEAGAAWLAGFGLGFFLTWDNMQNLYFYNVIQSQKRKFTVIFMAMFEAAKCL